MSPSDLSTLGHSLSPASLTHYLHSYPCRELHCLPDIWSLVEWSDWLTPRNLGRRYDTVFYLCCCETTPPINPDGTEVVDAQVGVARGSVPFKALTVEVYVFKTTGR